jgi:hypothetical protein
MMTSVGWNTGGLTGDALMRVAEVIEVRFDADDGITRRMVVRGAELLLASRNGTVDRPLRIVRLQAGNRVQAEAIRARWAPAS